MGVPACICAEEVANGLYSQGLQDVDCDEAGVVNTSLGRMVRAFLFMDDTTLGGQNESRVEDPDQEVPELL